MSNLPLHPEFESRYDSLGDLGNPNSWPRRVNVIEGSFTRFHPEPIYRRSNCFWNAVGISDIDGGSELWKEITLAATAPHEVAEEHILGLPVRLSLLMDTNATGKACGQYKLANRGAMDGTSIGTTSKELATRKWLSTQCSAVVDEIIFERGASLGGAGPRLRVMHAEIRTHLANGCDCPETREGFDRRWLQWHTNKQEYIEHRIKKDIGVARVDLYAQSKRKQIFNRLHFRKIAAEREAREERETACAQDEKEDPEESESNDQHDGFGMAAAKLLEREREAAEDLIREQQEEADLQRFLEREALEMELDEAWIVPDKNDRIYESRGGGNGDDVEHGEYKGEEVHGLG